MQISYSIELNRMAPIDKQARKVVRISGVDAKATKVELAN